MNQNRQTASCTGQFPAPDFTRRLERHPGPDDRPWWRLWMSGYAIPAVYTAWRAGIFLSCRNSYRSVDEVADACDISRRAARVLLNLIASVNLLDVQNECFRATAYASERFGKDTEAGEWCHWLKAQYDTPVTPDRLYDFIIGADDVTFPRSPDSPHADDRRLANLPWFFPSAVVADKLGVLELLASSPEQSLKSEYISRNLPGVKGNTDAIEPARLEQLLGHLQTAGIVSKEQEHCYRLVSRFAEFLNPAGCYYKGGTLRLMEMAPPSAAQSWKALEQERAPAESRMDETIKSPDLAETYAFALHMDAQGAGADAALACSGLLRSSDRVLDLAGGAGSYSICSAMQSLETRFFLLEQYPMTEVARSWIKQHGIGSNVEVLEGNMFELSNIEKVISDIKPDIVFASNIFHDWGPEENVALAREVYKTLPEGGRFILHEMPLAEDGFSCDIAAGFSETLRIWTEGMQYKISEIEEMLHRAGFRFSETADSLGPYKFIIAAR